jgi:hypothetical protein
MNTHQVTVNGQAVAVGRDHFRLWTMVRSVEHHDGDGKRVATHELAVEGVDASGTAVTQFVVPVPLKRGDVIQIVIGETPDAEPDGAGNSHRAGQ